LAKPNSTPKARCALGRTPAAIHGGFQISDSRFRISDFAPIYQSKPARSAVLQYTGYNPKSEI
jgi:hypothetical protein